MELRKGRAAEARAEAAKVLTRFSNSSRVGFAKRARAYFNEGGARNQGRCRCPRGRSLDAVADARPAGAQARTGAST